MLSKSLIIKISKLKRELDLGIITFYLSVQDDLNLPSANWLSFNELKQNIIYGLESAQANNPGAFIKTIRKIQRMYSEIFENDQKRPICLNEFFKFQGTKYELLNAKKLHEHSASREHRANRHITKR